MSVEPMTASSIQGAVPAGTASPRPVAESVDPEGLIPLSGVRRPLPLRTLSPLRYPGSKRRMIPAIAEVIEANVPAPELLVEPFCGGASVSLGLLEIGAVKRVFLADLDPLIAAFWKVATTDTDWLIAAMRKEPITVERWDYWRGFKPTGARNRALKCLFLNRTTFSGIIGGNAGPIGGRAQRNYKIDCRFDMDGIEARLRHVRELADEGRIVGVHEGRWQDSIRVALDIHATRGWRTKSLVFYMDPPYIEKAGGIYRRSFTERHHRDLAQYLIGSGERWILSYDKEPLVLDLYGADKVPEARRFAVPHTYTMTGSRSSPVPGREVLFTNLPQIPAARGEFDTTES
ncbi:hypothetical protein FB00_13480 [Cellulosimicrobium funkei]|uniref:site-specific DNA-methyltransferase (adenine-specific) n=1 Tax=Cellulosimicrobium funkei TaxID=264251 RepID=A0A0H2KQT1_9MICO|nr:DNA adenine methylase [Cellulosimicrobium funkei]KLN34184.1 hypothetical protein FB00_13480 [Cellulosimicrobium funkei]